MDTVRVIRIVEYVGPRDWVEDTVARSIHGTRTIGPDRRISAATIGAFPEIMQREAAPVIVPPGTEILEG